MKCNIELAEEPEEAKCDIILGDQMAKFSALILAIMTGDHSQFSFMVKTSV